MAITAKFQADFSSFLGAIDKAELALVDFGKGANKVESSLNRMVDNFSGRKVIQEASLMTIAVEKAGGTATLTAKELENVGNKASEAAEKLKKLGIDVPPGLQKLADETKKARTEMEGLGGKLDIEGLIANPLASATKGMEAFGASIGPAGVAAVGLAGGVVAIGAALLELTRHAAEAGGKLNDVSEVTGIAVPQLSRLSNASTVAGTDLQTMSNAIFMMQKNLGENPDKFQKGLERLNVDFEDFQSLSPDQQFLSIASALKATEDPVQRNSAGFELMGRQFRDLAPALNKMNEALAATADIQPFTDEEAKKAESFEMQLASIKVHIEAMGLSIGRFLIEPLSELVGVFTSVTGAAVNFAGGLGGILSPFGVAKELFGFASAALDVFRGSVNKTGVDVKSLADKQKELNDRIKDAANTPDASVKKWHDSASALAVTMQTVNDKVKQQTFLQGQLDIETKKSIDATNQAAAAQKKLRDEADKFANAVKSFSFGTFVADTSKLTAVVPDLSSHIEEMAGKFAEARDQMNDLESTSIAYNSAVLETDAGVRKMVTAFSTLPNVIPQSTAALKDAEAATMSFGATLRDNLLTELNRLPQQLAAAFTGGGNVGGAIKSIGTGLGATVGATFGKELGGTLGKVMPGVGAVAGATLADSTTGVISNTLSGAAIGTMILPGIGTAIGAGVGALVGGLKKLFNDVEKQVNPVRQAFVDLNGGLGALNEKAHAAGMTLDAMLNAKNPEQYTAAINALNDALKFQDDAMKTLDDTVAKYGFTISELGPTFAAQKLSEQAGSLLQDYEVLTAAGVDHVAIINKMGPALQDYVKQAHLTGAAIPEAMRPALQAMVDMGLLTDESGQAMTDLSQLTFAETLDKKFSSLIDTINKLTDAISRGLGTALQNIPQPDAIHVPVIYDVPGGGSSEPSYAAGGGYVGANGVQYLAGGGRVLGWPSRGSDTVRAMLTPGEGVVNQRGMKTLGKAGLAALNAGSGGGGDSSGVESRLDDLAQAMADRDRLLPKLIRDAVMLSSRRVA